MTAEGIVKESDQRHSSFVHYKRCMFDIHALAPSPLNINSHDGNMLLQGASASWSLSRDGSLKSRGPSRIGGVTNQDKTGKIEFQVRVHHYTKLKCIRQTIEVETPFTSMVKFQLSSLKLTSGEYDQSSSLPSTADDGIMEQLAELIHEAQDTASAAALETDSAIGM
jgi:hypothetical protein